MSHRPKFLIDECLHTSLVKVAHDRQYEAYHVVHLGMAGSKDHELMARIEAEDFTLVTNNAVDFRRRFREQAVHPGLVILIPSVTPSVQRLLFSAILDFIGERDLLNRVIDLDGTGESVCLYPDPSRAKNEGIGDRAVIVAIGVPPGTQTSRG